MLGRFRRIGLCGPGRLPGCIARDRGWGRRRTTELSAATARSGLDWSRAEAASITLLAVAILSFGSVPATVAAELDDFCIPMYPSEASFCISEELDSAEVLPASALKWRVKLSTCADNGVERGLRTLR